MRSCFLAALPAFLFIATAQAADFTETKFTASDAAADDYFGKVAAVSDSTIVIGAPLKDDGRGVAYLFDATTGAQTAKLVVTDTAERGSLGRIASMFSNSASGSAPWDVFGSAVAVSGPVAIVGAMGSVESHSYPGAAYLFDTATGKQTATLTASDGVAENFFGKSVAISDTTALVGAMWNDKKRGAVYLFDLATGTQTAKLIASDAAEGDFFGVSAAISDTTAIVGAVGKDDTQGTAYLFDLATGTQTAKLSAPDAAAKDGFGISVAISGTTAIVGAVAADDKRGAAYLFDTTTGAQIAKLTASDAAKYQQFGASVAIIGTTAIVGASGFNLDGGGAAYLFDATTGKQTAKLTPSDAARGNQFGRAVAISETGIIVGAREGSDNGVQSGAAYLFQRQ